MKSSPHNEIGVKDDNHQLKGVNNSCDTNKKKTYKLRRKPKKHLHKHTKEHNADSTMITLNNKTNCE